MSLDWERLGELFDAASELEPSRWDGFLEEHCGSNVEMRAELLSLLESQEKGKDRVSVLDLFEEASDEVRHGGRLQVGPYRLEKRIASGGMGTVWQAHRADDQYRKVVAVKIVKRGMDSDAIVARFLRERQVLADLEHPGITRLIDGGTSEHGQPYLVMEFVSGMAIDEYCRTADSTIRERIALMIEVCSAVDYAHKHGIVHRDLKPSNILVTPEGDPKLLDFGIAKLLGQEDRPDLSSLTMTGERILTPRYASPEQITGREATPATDVHALGIILHELLTGLSPFGEETTLRGLESSICEHEVRRPSSRTTGTTRRRLRGDLDVILLRALAKAPERRYSRAGEFAADLDRYLGMRPILARRDSVNYRARRFVRRNKILVGAVVGSVSALSVGLLIATVQYLRAEEGAEEARWSAYVSNIELAGRLNQSGDSAFRLLETMEPRYRGWEWRVQRARADFTKRVLYEGKELNGLSLDRTGRRLAMLEKGAIVVVDTETGAVVVRVALESRAIDPTISPDGKLLVWGHGQGLRMWAVATNDHIGDCSYPGRVRRLAFHSDSQHVVAVHKTGEVAVYDLHSPGSFRKLRRLPGVATGIAISPDDSMVAVTGSGKIYLLEFESGEVRWRNEITDRGHDLVCASFSSISPLVAASSLNGVVWVWDVATGRPASSPLRYGRYSWEMAFVPGRDEILLTQSGIVAHDLRSGRVRCFTNPRSGTVRSVVASSKTKRLFASSGDAIMEWNLDDEQLPRHHTADVHWDVVSIHPAGHEFLARTHSKWHLRKVDDTLAESTILKTNNLGHGGYSPRGDVFVLTGRNGVEVWDSARVELKKRVEVGHSRRAAFSRSGDFFATTVKKRILIMSTSTWEILGSVVTPWKVSCDLEFLSNGRLLVAGGDGKSTTSLAICDWRGTGWRTLCKLSKASVKIAVSPNGLWLAIADPGVNRHGLQVRATADGRLLMQEGVRTNYGDVLFTPDGSRMIVARFGVLALHETERWRRVAGFDYGLRTMLSMSMSADGKVLLTSTVNGDLFVWRIRED